MNDQTQIDTANAVAIATPQQLNELRLALHAGGYHPVPIIGAHVDTPSAGKKPTMTGWQTKCATADPEEIVRWSKTQADCTNTGILCGRTIGVDIDVLEEKLSAQLSELAQEVLGLSPLRRIGRAPKVLLVYRVATSITKLQTPALIFGDDPDTKADADKCKVEILAAGQQFVAFGIHPDTLQPYRWPEKSPLDIPFADVPLVTLEQLQRFVAEAEEVLRAAGGRTKSEIAKGKRSIVKESEKQETAAERETRKRDNQGYAAAGSRPGDKPSREKIASALRHIPNDLDYDEWIVIGFALYGELGDSGRDLWEAWSAAYTGNDPKVSAAKWPSTRNQS